MTRRVVVDAAVLALSLGSWVACVGDSATRTSSGNDNAATDFPSAAGEPLSQPVIHIGARLVSRPLSAPDLWSLYLPAIDAASLVPRPVAPLGQSIRQLEWADGVLYAAVGSVVMAYDTTGPDLQFVSVSERLPGIVMDVLAGDGVLYTAHWDLWSDDEREPGGLAVLETGAGRTLREVGRVSVMPGTGYAALARDGDTLVAALCENTEQCTQLDIIDAPSGSQPSVVSRVDVTDMMYVGPALAALGGGRFTEGHDIVDAQDRSRPSIVGSLESWGRPTIRGEILATAHDEVRLYRNLQGDAPVLLRSYEPIELGMTAGPRAEMATETGVMLTGPAAGKKETWTFIPVADGEVGEPMTGSADQLSAALALGARELWHASTPSRLDLWEVGDGTQPFTPSVGRQALGPDGRPVGGVEVVWTGWNWRTADVYTTGDIAYALVWDDDHTPGFGGSRAQWLALMVYDITDPESPRVIGTLQNACEAKSSPAEGGLASLTEDCSLTSSSPGVLLISGAKGAAVVDVSDPTQPMLVARGASLGSQLTTVGDGGSVITIHNGAGYVAGPAWVALYNSTGIDWPTKIWETGVVGQAHWLAVSGEVLSVMSLGHGAVQILRTGLLSHQAPPAWHEIKDPVTGGVPWTSPSLIGSTDRIYVQRSYVWRDQTLAPLPNDPGWVEEYVFSGAVPVLARAAALPGGRTGFRTALVGDVVVTEGEGLPSDSPRSYGNPVLTFVEFGASGNEPRVLASVPYADATIEGYLLAGTDLVPSLVPIGGSHFYVTGHPNAEVWTVP